MGVRVTVRRIVVTGNCLSRGLGEALAGLLGAEHLDVFPEWDLRPGNDLSSVATALERADLWVRIPLANGPDLGRLTERVSTVVDAPAFTFPAFHPDIVYATRRSDGSFFRGQTDYHSAIGLWAWRKGLSAAAATALFDDEVMRQLAYDAYWTPSVAGLKAAFDVAGLEFAPFWLRLKRLGVFMHSINHPRVEAIALLAKSIAHAVGAPRSVWEVPLERYLQDYLSAIVWPVYPTVARALGVPGHYGWRTPISYYPNLERWLAATWDSYDDGARDDLDCLRLDDGTYDAVLGERLPASVRGR